MKTVSDIRRENFLKLVDQCGSQRALADKLNRSPAQINQWALGSISHRTGRQRVISNDVAREIERKFGKPEGWLDFDQDAAKAIAPDADVLELAFKAVRKFEASNDVVLSMKDKAVLVSALYVHIASGAREASEQIGQAIEDIRRRLSST